MLRLPLSGAGDPLTVRASEPVRPRVSMAVLVLTRVRTAW